MMWADFQQLSVAVAGCWQSHWKSSKLCVGTQQKISYSEKWSSTSKSRISQKIWTHFTRNEIENSRQSTIKSFSCPDSEIVWVYRSLTFLCHDSFKYQVQTQSNWRIAGKKGCWALCSRWQRKTQYKNLKAEAFVYKKAPKLLLPLPVHFCVSRGNLQHKVDAFITI